MKNELDSNYIVETNNLTKKFGDKIACNKINMHIKKGDIYGFIGKNGAGKTTALKLILGLLSPNEGEIKLFNSNELDLQRKKIGSLIEIPGIYKNSSAYENMKRFSILYGGTDEDIKRILSLVGLDDVGKRKAGNFSLGMKQRLGIAIALLGNPEILVLDEPINGLDPSAIKEVRDIILKLNNEHGVTFIISSHLLDELAKITTKYGIIKDGILVEEVGAEELLDRCYEGLEIRVSNPQMAYKLLSENFEFDNYKLTEFSVIVYNHVEESYKMNEILVKNGFNVYELKQIKNDFENYFIERIG